MRILSYVDVRFPMLNVSGFTKGVIIIKRKVSVFCTLILVFAISFSGCKDKADSSDVPSETKITGDIMQSCEMGTEAIDVKSQSEKQTESSGRTTDVFTTDQNEDVNENTLRKAYSLAQDAGYSGSIHDWIAEATVERESRQGKSAYQIATENGYKGLQTEWVDQLLKTESPETTDGSISGISVTDSGHLVVTIENGITIETDDVITPPESDSVVFTVTFLDIDGSICKVQQVSKGKSAIAPLIENPDFLGWDGNYINVQQDETVKAVYSDSKNVFQVVSAEGDKGGTVSILVRLDGKMELCGFDMTLTYNPALKLVSVNDALDIDVVVNSDVQNRAIHFNFSNAMNKNHAMNIMELTFQIVGTQADAYDLRLAANAVKTLVGNRVEDADYTILNGVVYVHE